MGIGVAGGLEAKPHWAPVQGPSTSTGRGVGCQRGIRWLARCLGGIGASMGARGHWGGRWTGSPTTLGPSPVSQHCHRQGCRGCQRGWQGVEVSGDWQGVEGGTGVVGGLGAQPHWAPVQGNNTSTGRGVGCQRGIRWLARCLGGIGASMGARGQWGGRWTGSQTTLGTSPGKQHFHWQGCRVSEGNQVACQVF